jgi:hypothetical protein
MRTGLGEMVTSLFQTYIGIDYSGAKTAISRLKGLRVCKATRNAEPTIVKSIVGENWNWTRKDLAHWCLEQLKRDDPTIIGIDHGFSFPVSYMKRYQISNWDQFLEDFQKHWPTDQEDSSVEGLRDGNQRIGHQSEFRITENWTASVQSVFKLDGAGTVGKSTHCGIPWLRYIRRNADSNNRPFFWPFDGFTIPSNKSVIVEIFPSIFRKRYPKKKNYTADEHDAMCVAKWLKDMDDRGILSTYFNPPLTDEERKIVKLEGWILGVF